MQQKMKTHSLGEEQIVKVLNEVHTGSLATVNADGTPYVIPVHFVYSDNNIFIHGCSKGQKIDNIIGNDNVCFMVYNMLGYKLDSGENPCKTNTVYESVIVNGRASLAESAEVKANALHKIIEKYTPHLKHKELPEALINITAIIKIEILEKTGKYYN